MNVNFSHSMQNSDKQCGFPKLQFFSRFHFCRILLLTSPLYIFQKLLIRIHMPFRFRKVSHEYSAILNPFQILRQVPTYLSDNIQNEEPSFQQYGNRIIGWQNIMLSYQLSGMSTFTPYHHCAIRIILLSHFFPILTFFPIEQSHCVRKRYLPKKLLLSTYYGKNYIFKYVLISIDKIFLVWAF